MNNLEWVTPALILGAIATVYRIWILSIKPTLESQAKLALAVEHLSQEVGLLRKRQEEACQRLGKLEVHVERNRETLKKINGFAK